MQHKTPEMFMKMVHIKITSRKSKHGMNVRGIPNNLPSNITLPAQGSAQYFTGVTGIYIW